MPGSKNMAEEFASIRGFACIDQAGCWPRAKGACATPAPYPCPEITKHATTRNAGCRVLLSGGALRSAFVTNRNRAIGRVGRIDELKVSAATSPNLKAFRFIILRGPHKGSYPLAPVWDILYIGSGPTLKIEGRCLLSDGGPGHVYRRNADAR